MHKLLKFLIGSGLTIDLSWLLNGRKRKDKMDTKDNDKISEHLSKAEVHCKCKRCQGLDGLGYGGELMAFSPRTAELFEKIRRFVSLFADCDTPIAIASGFRCREHNDAIGGAPDSMHLRGIALDLRLPDNISIGDFHWIAHKIMKGQGGLGFYDTFIHIDSGTPRTWGDIIERKPV
jgi:uncharacterized protein YcbK (DUF882 family)